MYYKIVTLCKELPSLFSTGWFQEQFRAILICSWIDVVTILIRFNVWFDTVRMQHQSECSHVQGCEGGGIGGEMCNVAGCLHSYLMT